MRLFLVYVNDIFLLFYKRKTEIWIHNTPTKIWQNDHDFIIVIVIIYRLRIEIIVQVHWNASFSHFIRLETETVAAWCRRQKKPTILVHRTKNKMNEIRHLTFINMLNTFWMISAQNWKVVYVISLVRSCEYERARYQLKMCKSKET